MRGACAPTASTPSPRERSEFGRHSAPAYGASASPSRSSLISGSPSSPKRRAPRIERRLADLPPQQQGGGSADDKCVARALARIAREMYAGSIDALMGIVASIEKRIEAAAVRAQPV